MANGEAIPADHWIKAFAIGRRPVWTLVRVCGLILGTFLIFHYLVLLRKIEGASMAPTLLEGSIHLINRRAYTTSNGPQRGDIVAIRTSGETVMYVKRVIALPNETVEIRDGEVFIDGDPLHEPYVRFRRHSRPLWNWPTKPPRPRLIEPGHYLVIGDNRSMPQELHDFGVVTSDRIAGKVLW